MSMLEWVVSGEEKSGKEEPRGPQKSWVLGACDGEARYCDGNRRLTSVPEKNKATGQSHIRILTVPSPPTVPVSWAGKGPRKELFHHVCGSRDLPAWRQWGHHPYHR